VLRFLLHCPAIIIANNAKYHKNTIFSYVSTNIFYNKNVEKVKNGNNVKRDKKIKTNKRFTATFIVMSK